ncbi:EamA family transporter [Brevibacillus sp. SYP-B805]|uniref:DMT family transporter n=1 Tax=Brevibacillus sp. SYP-B805 TaxID=1578199 RepID=UPI0013EA9387|nr:EamA family transporter [Brevibacillus sp. SYP-B805]NGQ95970.1 EamA family transporter [Brevibacillus sp. SYP-B805]
MLLGYVVMCLIFGTSYLMIKIGLMEGIPPFQFAGLRFLIAGALVLAFLGIRRQLPRLSVKIYAEVALLGFLMTTIPFASLFWAEQHVSSGTAALLVATAPIFTLFLGLVLREIRFRWHLFLGLAVSLCGVALLVSHNLGGETAGLPALAGKLSIMGSELFFSLGVIRSRKLMGKIPPFVFNGYQSVFGSLGLLLISFFTEQVSAAAYTFTAVTALLYLAIVVSIVASSIYYWLVKETNSTFPTTWTYVAPVLAMVNGTLFLDEALTVEVLQGGVAVLVGIILLNWETWQKIASERKAKKNRVPANSAP